MKNKILSFEEWRDKNLEYHLRKYGDYKTDDFMFALICDYDRYLKSFEKEKEAK